MWIKIDDRFTEDPKIIKAGPLASWLHFKALVYCGRNMTDGFVPRNLIKTLVDWGGVALHYRSGGSPVSVGDEVNNDDLVDALIDAELWDEAPDGFRIRNFLKYNPSKADLLAKKKATSAVRAEAGKRGMDSRWGGKSEAANADNKHHNKTITNYNPEPEPEPEPEIISHSVPIKEQHPNDLLKTVDEVKLDQQVTDLQMPMPHIKTEITLSKLMPITRAELRHALHITTTKAPKPNWGYLLTVIEGNRAKNAPMKQITPLPRYAR